MCQPSPSLEGFDQLPQSYVAECDVGIVENLGGRFDAPYERHDYGGENLELDVADMQQHTEGDMDRIHGRNGVVAGLFGDHCPKSDLYSSCSVRSPVGL